MAGKHKAMQQQLNLLLTQDKIIELMNDESMASQEYSAIANTYLAYAQSHTSDIIGLTDANAMKIAKTFQTMADQEAEHFMHINTIAMILARRKKNMAFPGSIDPEGFSERVTAFKQMASSIKQGQVDMYQLAANLDTRIKNEIVFPPSVKYQGVVFNPQVPRIMVDIISGGAWGPGAKSIWDTTEKLESIIKDFANRYPGLLLSWGPIGIMPKYYQRVGFKGKIKSPRGEIKGLGKAYSESKHKKQVFADIQKRHKESYVKNATTPRKNG